MITHFSKSTNNNHLSHTFKSILSHVKPLSPKKKLKSVPTLHEPSLKRVEVEF